MAEDTYAHAISEVVVKNGYAIETNSQYNFDCYYLYIAHAVGEKSNCLSRHIGSVVVKDNIVIGTGYNGPPRGIPHCNDDDAYFKIYDGVTHIKGDCPRKLAGAQSGEMLDNCLAVHSERNALLAAARSGVSTTGATLYCFCGPPCCECMKEIIQAGIRRIVCLDDAWYDTMSEYLFHRSHMWMTQLSRDEIEEWIDRGE